MPFYRPVRRWIALLMFSGLLTEECIALELRFPLTEVVRTHRSQFSFLCHCVIDSRIIDKR